jgi:hypothetical protein
VYRTQRVAFREDSNGPERTALARARLEWWAWYYALGAALKIDNFTHCRLLNEITWNAHPHDAKKDSSSADLLVMTV